MVSRNPAMAVSGTRIERNATISRSSASPTTTARYGVRASDICWEMSMFTAVWPVTASGAPVCCWMAGASSRMALTRSFVAAEDGPLSGTTVMIARSFASFRKGDATLATLSRLRSRAAVVSAACAGSVTPARSATTVRGPLNPGPNPVASRS